MATILIVDHRPESRELVAAVLQCSGHQVLEASDGAEGLDIARAEAPDLVIADILMPQIGGYEFVNRLRGDPLIGDLPVIFCTATYLEREVRALADSCGVRDVVSKPLDFGRLRHAVDSALSSVASDGSAR